MQSTADFSQYPKASCLSKKGFQTDAYIPKPKTWLSMELSKIFWTDAITKISFSVVQNTNINPSSMLVIHSNNPLKTYIMSVLNSVGLVPSWVSWASCHRATVPSWVFNFLSWIFCGSKVFSRGYFLGLKLFFVSISWVQTFSRGYFCGSKFFSRVCYVGTSRIYISEEWEINALLLSQ